MHGKGNSVRPVIRKLAVVGLPVLVASALATPASAEAAPFTSGVAPASAPADCPAGDLCFWVDAGYKGAMGELAGNNGSWTKFSEQQCPHANWNDCASAIYNHGTSDNARVFRDSNGGGGGACLPRGTLWSNLTSHYFDNGVNMNDAISSNDWISSACP